jgi:hypothetical protein
MDEVRQHFKPASAQEKKVGSSLDQPDPYVVSDAELV